MSETPLHYVDYIQLDKILTAQNPRSKALGKEAHDEHFFIVVHQVYEIWFKQILHELDSVLQIFTVLADDTTLEKIVARLMRIAHIQRILNEQIPLLQTMTPSGFMEFRDLLEPASGMQSIQFRLIEAKLGLTARVPYGKAHYLDGLREQDKNLLEKIMVEPTLFDIVQKWLNEAKFLKLDEQRFWQEYESVVRSRFKAELKAVSENQGSADSLKAQQQQIKKTQEQFSSLFAKDKFHKLQKNGVWRLNFQAARVALIIYSYPDVPSLYLPYQVLTALVEIDELLACWRYAHALMVQRMIGGKVGTGGSAGFDYLKDTADKQRIFADYTNLATFLLPKQQLPKFAALVKNN